MRYIIAQLLLLGVVLGTSASTLPGYGSRADRQPIKATANSDQEAIVVAQAEVAASAGASIRFEENVGQTDARARFVARLGSDVLFLTPDAAVFRVNSSGTSATVQPPHRFEMRFEAADSSCALVGEHQLPGLSHYFLGDRPERWQVGVRSFGSVRSSGLYPGIDVVYYGTETGELEFDLVVAPGADASMIRLAFDGADALAVDGRGAIIAEVAGKTLRFDAPVAFQPTPVGAKRVGARFVVTGHQVSFAVTDIDPAYPLVIDPVLRSSTYLGGSAHEFGLGTTVDSQGFIYVTGSTDSLDFPTVAPIQSSNGGIIDAYVTKFDPSGATVLFSTYLGGDHDDRGWRLAIDSTGVPCLAGLTHSTNFPTVNPLQTDPGDNDYDFFFVKIAPSGSSLLYSTYIGGNGNDQATGLALDSTDNVFLAGISYSSNFPTVQPAQAMHAGNGDFVALKMNAAGSALIYSTYLGGSAFDFGQGIEVDAAGNAFIAGYSQSSNFPVSGAIQSTFGGDFDIIVAKLSSAGSLVFSTYLGGPNRDLAWDLTLDSFGNPVVGGETPWTSFPTVNAYQPTLGGGIDGFIARLNSSGTAITASTYFGGSANDWVNEVGLGPNGTIYAIGSTSSNNFPLRYPLQASVLGSDAFVARFNLDAGPTGLFFSTSIGGSSHESALGLALDSSGTAIIVGDTSSADFPVRNPWIGTYTGELDAFLVRVSPAVFDLALTKTHSGDFVAGSSGTYTLTVANLGPDATLEPVVVSDSLPSGMTFVSGSGSGWNVNAAGQGVTATYAAALPAGQTASWTLTVAVASGASASVVNQASVSSPGDYSVANNVATDSTTIVQPPAIDLALSKTHAQAFVAGSTGAYTLTVTNVGTAATAGAVTVTDQLPSGLSFVSASGDGWTAAAAGSVVTLTHNGSIGPGVARIVTLTVSLSLTAVPEVVNSATVSVQGDGNSSNDTASVSTSVARPIADLSLAIVESVDPASSGGQLLYTLTVNNPGPGPALNVMLSDPIPAATVYAGAQVSQGTISGPAPGASGTLTANLGTIAPNSSATVSLGVLVTANPGATLTNTASVTTGSTDPIPSNNTSTVATGVVAPATTADVSVSMSTEPNVVRVGGRLQYTIVVRNNGPDPAESVALFDALPERVRFENATTSQGVVEAPPSGSSGLVRVAVGTLGIGASATVTINVHVIGPPGVLENTVAATASSTDPQLANNTGTVSTDVGPVRPPVVVSVRAIAKAGAPWRLKITGTDFNEGVEILIGDDATSWSDVRRKGAEALILGRGRTLKSRFPRGEAVRIVVRNSDGGTAEVTFTR